MTSTARYIHHLDTTFTTVRQHLAATIRQLHQWTGGYPTTVVGASPPTGPTPDNDTITLTRLETDALNPDDARRALVRCYQLVDQLVTSTTTLDPHHPIPTPDHRLASRIAYIQWHINRIIEHPPGKPFTDQLRDAYNTTVELAALCDTYRPTPATVKPVDVCHAHEAAGLVAPISPHWRRHHLCDWCGKFRNLHGINPTPQLVQLHDRGIKMSPTILRRAGIKSA